jgi:GNAT superfamily N-acetyltransferase
MPRNPSARDASGVATAAAAASIGSSVTIVPLQASMARAVQHMTFPAYRHLLSLEENVRHPDDGDTRRVQPLGVVAMLDGRPIGLALAELPVLPIPPLPPSPKEGGLADLVGPVAPLPQGDATGTPNARKSRDASSAHSASSALGVSSAGSASAALDASFASDAGTAGDARAADNATAARDATAAGNTTAARDASGVGNASGVGDAGGEGDASAAGDASGASGALLSLFVDASMRGRGVGTALVAAIEEALRGPRPVRLEAVYMTGKADVAAIERVFVKRGWQPPAMRTYTLRFTTDDAERMPWFGRVPLRDRDFEMFAWGELGQPERDALIASQQARPWIPEGLEFWRHDHAGFDPVSSLGLRYRGAVVGWTINHRIAADTTRISGAFVRDDLSRRGRLMALWTESITRMKDDGVRWITSITPHQLAPMVAFLARRCAPWATFCGETRGTYIDLLPLTQPSPCQGRGYRTPSPRLRGEGWGEGSHAI